MPNPITLNPLRFERMLGKFDLVKSISSKLTESGLNLVSGDILVVSSKFISMSQGRLVNLAKVKVTGRARILSSRYEMDPPLAQLVLNESDEILGGIPGFMLASSSGVLSANAGIDRSNVPRGYAILYPRNPNESAAKLRRGLIRWSKRAYSSAPISRLGVIICDSRITPMRIGTTGVAIAVSGLEPVEDLRGSRDLFGNELKVTIRGIADQLASAAEFVMGESDDAIPVVLIRGARVRFSNRPRSKMVIEKEKCLIVRGLENRIDVDMK